MSQTDSKLRIKALANFSADKKTEKAKRLGVEDRIKLYSMITRLMASGKPFTESASQVAKEYRRVASAEGGLSAKQIARNAEPFELMVLRARQGFSISKTVEGMIPDSEQILIMAGEKGDVIKGFEAAKIQALANQEMKSTLRKGLTYPVILSIVLMIAMHFLGTGLLQALTAIVPVNNWAGWQQKVFWITNNVAVWLAWVIAFLIALTFIIKRVNRVVVGDARTRIHSIPPFNIIRRVTGAGLLTTLSSLLMAQDKFNTALDRIIRSSNDPYTQAAAQDILTNMRTGAKGEVSPGAAMDIPLFTPEIRVRLGVFGATSMTDFSEAMQTIAAESREEAIKAVQRLTSIFNILILAAIGMTVAAVVLTSIFVTMALT